jgi:general stress protein 26
MNLSSSTPSPFDVRRLKELIGSQRICMFTEPQRDGSLTSRPMTVLGIDKAGALWFMTSIEHLPHADWPVSAAFANEDANRFVSVTGIAQAVQDSERIHELWSVMCRPWFPMGPDSPEIVLIRFAPDQVEFWEGPSNPLARGASLLASVVARRPIGLGEHGRLNL